MTAKRVIKETPSDPLESQPKFEVALDRLEKVVQQMESGDLSLEDALKRYEEGVGLARYCTQKLNEIQKRVDVLRKDPQGKWVRQPFEAEQGSKEESD